MPKAANNGIQIPKNRLAKNIVNVQVAKNPTMPGKTSNKRNGKNKMSTKLNNKQLNIVQIVISKVSKSKRTI